MKKIFKSILKVLSFILKFIIFPIILFRAIQFMNFKEIIIFSIVLFIVSFFNNKIKDEKEKKKLIEDSENITENENATEN